MTDHVVKYYFGTLGAKASWIGGAKASRIGEATDPYDETVYRVASSRMF